MRKRFILGAAVAALSLGGAAIANRSDAAVVLKTTTPAVFSHGSIPQTNRPFVIGVRANPEAVSRSYSRYTVAPTSTAAPILVGFVESSPDLSGFPTVNSADSVLKLSIPDTYIPSTVSAINLTAEFDDLTYSGPFTVTFRIGPTNSTGGLIAPISMTGNITPFNYYTSSGTIPRPSYSGPATIKFYYAEGSGTPVEAATQSVFFQ